MKLFGKRTARVYVPTHMHKCSHLGETRRHGNDRVLLTPEGCVLSLRCPLPSCACLGLGMGVGKCGPQASRGATVPRVGKVSLLQAASPLKPEAVMFQ